MLQFEEYVPPPVLVDYYVYNRDSLDNWLFTDPERIAGFLLGRSLSRYTIVKSIYDEDECVLRQGIFTTKSRDISIIKKELAAFLGE